MWSSVGLAASGRGLRVPPRGPSGTCRAALAWTPPAGRLSRPAGTLSRARTLTSCPDPASPEPRRSSSPTSRGARGSGSDRRDAMAVALEAHDGCSGRQSRRPAGPSSRRPATGCSRPSTDAEAARDGRHRGPARARRARLAATRAACACGWRSTPGAPRSGTATSSGPRSTGSPACSRSGTAARCSSRARRPRLVADDLPPGASSIDLGEHRLRDLDRPEHVFQLAAPGLRREFPPLRTAAEHPTNLPAPGRPRSSGASGSWPTSRGCSPRVASSPWSASAAPARPASSCRLRRMRSTAFATAPGSSSWRPISDRELVAAEIARALGVQPQPGQAAVRHDRRLPALQGAAPAPRQLRAPHRRRCRRGASPARRLSRPAACSRSSREPLGVDGEAVFAVPSLALPELDDGHDAHGDGRRRSSSSAGRPVRGRPAVRRSGGRDPAVVRAGSANVRAVVEICRRLDGIPLALELAAARVNVLSVDEIAQGLGDRFRLLTGGRRTAVPRQRDAPGAHRLELGPARRRRIACSCAGWPSSPAAGRSMPPRRSRSGPPGRRGVARARSADARFADARRPRPPRRSLARRGRPRWVHPLPDARDDPPVRGGPARRERRDDRAPRSAPGMLLRGSRATPSRGLGGPEWPRWLARLDAEIDNLRSALDWALENAAGDRPRDLRRAGPYWMSRTMGAEGLRPHAARRWAACGRCPSPSRSPRAGRDRVLIARALAVAT